MLLSQLVGYSQCQDSLLNQIEFARRFDHYSLFKVSLFLKVELERSFKELALLREFDQLVYKIHQAYRLLL